MEVLIGMVVLVALGAVVLAITLKTSWALLFGVVLPLAWLWMLVDAVLRAPERYPSADVAEKILWIVGMIVFQPLAIAYYVVVFRTLDRRETTAATVTAG